MGILVGAYFFFQKTPAKEDVSTANSERVAPLIPVPTTAVVPVIEPPKEEPIVIEKKTTEEKNPEFGITTAYPALKKGDVSVDDINATIRIFVDGTIKQFKDDFNNAKKEGSTGNPDETWSLTIGYDTPYQSSDYISLELSVDSYEGGAHPNGTVKTFVVDVKNQKILSLDDILISNTSLKDLSALAIADLKKRNVSDDDWITSGASGKTENYQAWYLSSNGLTILFSSYQVAPYAAGVQEVTISPLKLSDLIKPEYILTK